MKSKLRKNLLVILFVLPLTLIITFNLVCHTLNAYAFNKFIERKTWYEGGSASKEPITLYVDESNAAEIMNFATVSKGTVQGYNSLSYPIITRPTPTTNYNSLDYIVYMIKKLETYAETYAHAVRYNMNNCVLGYIRGINRNYTGATEHSGNAIYDSKQALFSYFGFDYWQVVAGTIDWGFVNKVRAEEANQNISLMEFFGSYLNSADDYNEYLHGYVGDYVINNPQNPRKKLKDPLGSGQSIDLIHMFASLDGVYERTDYHDTTCKTMLGNKHFQRDLVTWLGDLQTLAKNMAEKGTEINKLKTYSAEMGHIDFNEFISQPNSEITNFSSEDLLADIDAFNIAKFYLNNEYNSLSDSIIGYYTTINKDDALKGNRYYSFIYNVTRELNRPSSGDMEQDFRNEVCNAMNVKYENGNYYDCEYYSEDSYNLKLMNGGREKPDFAIRKYCSKLFCDYIIAMSHRF